MKDKFTPAFWKWFGESKVTDKKGKPLIVYHATDASFSIFRMSDGELGNGAYFTDDKTWAKEFGSRLIPVYLRIEHPQIFKGDYGDFEPKHGHDGVIAKQSPSAPAEFVVFSPNQIKAIDNDGTFDADDLNIRSNPMKPKSLKTIIKNLNEYLYGLGKIYHREVPVLDVMAAMVLMGITVLDEDASPLEGFILTGREGRASFALKYEDNVMREWWHFSWYKMPRTGNYEFTSYIS